MNFLKGVGEWPSRVFAAGVTGVVLICSVYGLLPRLKLEQDNRNVAIVVDYREMLPMAQEAGLSAETTLEFLKKKGVVGLMVKEYTAEDVQYEIGPDFEGLKAGTAAGMPIFYRVAPAPTWQLRQSLETTRQILSEYPGVVIVSPSGEIALGYPDLMPLASLLKEHDVSVAQTEFSRQLGASQLNGLAFPRLIPLHSVTNEELLVRRIDRAALHDRFVRAAVERSVRLLVLRPAASGNVSSSLESFGGEVARLVEDLQSRGLQAAWPQPVFAQRPGWRMNWSSALACSMVFLLSLGRYLKRMKGTQERALLAAESVLFVAFAVALALAAWKIAAFARALGAFSAAFVTTEASLIVMDVTAADGRRFWRTLPEGFLFATVGGLAIAALFSEPIYMLRLRTFSGVKLTLLLPPLLVALHDMRRRVHPESLAGFLSRPPLWGEFFLGLVLLALLALALFRSDNVQFIPGFEAKVRETLERFLIARPRNKEVFVGYPCLLLYTFAVNSGLWARYREIFRVGVVLGFSSVVNSFCHYHTPLFFILLREFHGLWVGAIVGVLAVFVVKYAVLPLWRKLCFLTE
ncbi:MAG: DUF5693 family protein [Synergistaceae bacterium]|jgi:hypothetical protein|nr:DUF5693 family protein [Synergistaceae bacterium]